MYRFLRYLIGYRKIEFKKADVELVYNFLYEYRITSWGYSEEKDEICSLYIANTDYNYFIEFQKKLNATNSISSVMGLPRIFEKYKKRAGIWIGIFLFMLVMIVSSLFVWDVRVFGAYQLNEAEIIENLKNEGLHIGTFIPKIKSTEICNNYIMKYDDVAWMSINKRGNVVNVEIIEAVTNENESEETKGKYANLVASEDAVIEEITVSRGMVNTKVGKTVKKGELLISGIYESPRRYSFVYAKGEVFGRVNREIIVEIPFEQEVKSYKESKISQISVNFFGFTINIFRYSGKMPNKYDTIYKREQVVIFNKVKLPIYITSKRYCEYHDELVHLSESEAVKLAFSRLKAELASATIDCALASKSISGSFTETSYILKCNAECVKNIATPLEFEAN